MNSIAVAATAAAVAAAVQAAYSSTWRSLRLIEKLPGPSEICRGRCAALSRDYHR